jgi:hypothetical protein
MCSDTDIHLATVLDITMQSAPTRRVLEEDPAKCSQPVQGGR